MLSSVRLCLADGTSDHTPLPLLRTTRKTLSLTLQVEKSFLQNERGYRDGLKHQKGRNKGSLHSKVAQSYMTPSLYLCSIFNFAYKQ